MAKLVDSQRITEKNSNSSTKSVKLNKSQSDSMHSQKALQNNSNLSANKLLESVKDDSNNLNQNIELKDTINFQLLRLQRQTLNFKTLTQNKKKNIVQSPKESSLTVDDDPIEFIINSKLYN